MDEINLTWASSSLVLVVQIMMQLVSMKNFYFAQNVMHPYTPNKMDHASLMLGHLFLLSTFCFHLFGGTHIKFRSG